MIHNKILVNCYKSIAVIVLALVSLWLTCILLYGHIFIYSVPLILLIIVIALIMRLPSFYFRYLTGFLLQFGLLSGYLGYFAGDPEIEFSLSFLVGAIGFILVLISCWQAIFNVKKLPRWLEIILTTIGTVTLLACLWIAGHVVYNAFTDYNLANEYPQSKISQ